MGYVDVAHVSFALPDGRMLLDDVSFRVGDGVTVALVGANGVGKTTLLRLVAGDIAPTSGGIARDGGLGVMRQFIGSVRDDTTVRELLLGLAAPTVRQAGERLERAEWALAGLFVQTHEHPDLEGRTPVEILWRGEGSRVGLDRGRAVGALRRYELHGHADVRFELLSGGQQARLQILLLELAGATMLLLDEPTDNLDVVSAQALQDGLAGYAGTVLAVTHDRWFARAFDRYLVFGARPARCSSHPNRSGTAGQ
jgi:ATPase subunit of ABC transporter with duplicated ATPase domains